MPTFDGKSLEPSGTFPVKSIKFSEPTLTPRERLNAWDRGDPEELLRAAEEWEQLGYPAYADFLRRCPTGDMSSPVPRPF